MNAIALSPHGCTRYSAQEADPVCEKRWYHGAVPSLWTSCFLFCERGDSSVEKLYHPGTILVVIGAVLTYGGNPIAGKLFPEKDKAGNIVKIVGCAMAVLGAAWLFLTT